VQGEEWRDCCLLWIDEAKANIEIVCFMGGNEEPFLCQFLYVRGTRQDAKE
jgi:hypothetical protein